MAFHPATLIAAWGLFVLLVQRISVGELAAVSLLVVPLAFFRAPRRSWALLKRARWLILSVAVLFAFATPGHPLVAGTTREGLALAGEHGLRLVLLLVSLAGLHEILGNAGLLAGLYVLLSPLGSWRDLRSRLVARLQLVLDYVENGPGPGGWRAWLADPAERGAESMLLPAYAMGGADFVAWVLLAAAVIAWGALP